MDLISESGRTLKRMLSFERKRVYLFEEGSDKNIRLFGQKGSALVELTKLGLPVPPGFIITTENFLEYVNHGEEIKEELIKSYTSAIHSIEKKTGRIFGRPSNDGKKLPLLLAIRAGTAIIVPGVMDTILNVGMSDIVVEYLVQLNPGLLRFALDLHRRFLNQYGVLVLRNSAYKYEKILTEARERDSVQSNDKLSVDALTFVVAEFRRFTNVPEDPYEQLKNVIEAMYQHSYSPKVSQSLDEYSVSVPQIPRALAITVQSMVYGNLNKDSGSGVAFSRRPGGNDSVPVGEFLSNAEGKEVLDGKRKPTPFEDLMIDMPTVYEDLIRYMRLLEKHDEAIQYIEFTVEDGQLYILETSSVNLRPNMIDSRYVVYYDLLLHLQEEEEKLEEKLDEEVQEQKQNDQSHHHNNHHSNSETKYDNYIPSSSHDTHDAKHHSEDKYNGDRLSLDEVLDNEIDRISAKSHKHK